MSYELRRRLAITIASIVAARLLLQVPVPFLEVAVWRELFGPGSEGLTRPLIPARGSLAGAGLHAYIAASVLLSFLHAVGPLGAMRDRPRERHVVALAIAIALMQGFAAAYVLESKGASFGLLGQISGGWFRLSTATAYAVGTCVTILLAHVITIRGIGNGVCLLMGMEYLSLVVNGVGVRPDWQKEMVTRGGVAVAALLVFAWTILAVVILRARWSAAGLIRDSAGSEPKRLALRVAGVGIVGMSLAESIVGGLPMAIEGFLPPVSEAATLLVSIAGPGILHGILFVALAFFLTAMFTAWAYAPPRLERNLERALGPPADRAPWLDGDGYQSKLERNALPVALLLPVAVIVSTSTAAALGIIIPWPLAFLVVAAITFDTERHWRLHRHMAEAIVPVRDDDPDRLRCTTCGAWSRDDLDDCPACGTQRKEGERCDAHPEAVCEGRCVVCRRRLCASCRWSYAGRSLCQAHREVTLVEGWAIVSAPETTVEAELLGQRLEAHGIEAVVLANTVAPYYGTDGLFEIRRMIPLVMHPECGGGGIALLVRPESWEAAGQVLAARPGADAAS